MSDQEFNRCASVPSPLSLKANMLWNSAGSLTYLACQWLVTVLVVRLTSGYDAAGLLSLAMSVTGIFGTFATYKMNTYQISDVHHEHKLADYLGFRLVMLVGAFAACMVYALLTCTEGALLTIALFYGFKGVGLVIDVLHGADQQHRRMDYIGKSFMLQGVGTLAAFALVFGLTQSLNAAIVAMGAAALAVLVLFDLPHTGRLEAVSVRVNRAETLFFLRTSLPAVVASVAASALFTIPKQYLAVDAGDAALGIYASVSAIALVVQMGAQYLYVPLLDVFPRAFFDEGAGAFKRLLAKAVAGILAMSVAATALLVLLGPWVLGLLFGESILPYAYLLLPVILATVATAFLWFLGDLLIALRDFRGNFWGNIAALAAVCALTVPLVGAYDMNGVSFAGAGACLVGVAVCAAFLARDVRRRGRSDASEAETEPGKQIIPGERAEVSSPANEPGISSIGCD